jgi:hypothetical protein
MNQRYRNMSENKELKKTILFCTEQNSWICFQILRSLLRSSSFSLKTINPEILDKLKRKNMDHEKPLFIYAHLMMPHDPYLFDEYGKIHEDDSVFFFRLKNRYLGQLKYVNKLVVNTISTIFKNDTLSPPPLIIIQGDHGFRYLPENGLQESMTIFNAYYFPDEDYSQIYDSISPVNTFRVIFNKYMGTRLPIMNDSSTNVFLSEINSY